jgi:hypothetical protein
LDRAIRPFQHELAQSPQADVVRQPRLFLQLTAQALELLARLFALGAQTAVSAQRCLGRLGQSAIERGLDLPATRTAGVHGSSS